VVPVVPSTIICSISLLGQGSWITPPELQVPVPA